ncbi:hypothetical protein GCM10010234_49320 [Streptomyces hawaiiensis]
MRNRSVSLKVNRSVFKRKLKFQDSAANRPGPEVSADRGGDLNCPVAGDAWGATRGTSDSSATAGAGAAVPAVRHKVSTPAWAPHRQRGRAATPSRQQPVHLHPGNRSVFLGWKQIGFRPMVGP